MALCVVNLIDCRPMVESDQEAAQCEVYEGAWSWVFENIRPMEPFPVRGQLGIYDGVPAGYPADVSLNILPQFKFFPSRRQFIHYNLVSVCFSV